MRKSWWKKLLAPLGMGPRRHRRAPLGVESLEDRLSPSVNNVWTDADLSNSWNDPKDWSRSHVPVPGEIAVFDGAAPHGNDSVTITGATPTVDGIDVLAGYTGTITDNSTLTVGDFTQAGGTFAFMNNAAALLVSGDWNTTGATFNADKGTVTFSGASQSLTSAGISFNDLIHDGTGPLLLQDTLSVAGTLTNTAGTLDANGHDVSANALSLADNFKTGTSNLTVGDGGVLMTGSTFIAPGAAKTFDDSGDFTNNGGTFTANSGTVTFDGAAQSLTSGGISFNNLTHNGTGTLTLQDALTVTGTLTNTAGMLAANGQIVSAGTLSLADDFSAGTSNLTVGAGGVTLTGGTFTAPGSANTFDDAGNFTISGGVFAPNGGTVTFNGAGQSLTTAGTTFAGVTHNGTGTLVLQDALTLTGTLTNTAGALNTNSQSVAANALAFAANVNAAASTVTVGGGGVSLTGGAFTAPGAAKTFDDSGDFTNNGGTFTANSGTVTFDGAAQSLTSGGIHFNNLVHNGTGALTLQDALTVTGTVTNTAGTLAANGQSVSAGMLSLADDFSAGTSNLTVGTGGATLTGGTFTAPGSANTFDDGGNFTISGGVFAPNGGTVTFNGAAQSLTTAGTTFAGVTHSGAGTLTLQDALIATGTLTNTTNTLDLNGQTVSAAATLVSGGALIVDGPLTSNVTVNRPGTLAGTNTITGNVTGSGTIAARQRLAASASSPSPATSPSPAQSTSRSTPLTTPREPISTRSWSAAASTSSGGDLHITGGTAVPHRPAACHAHPEQRGRGHADRRRHHACPANHGHARLGQVQALLQRRRQPRCRSGGRIDPDHRLRLRHVRR